MPWTTEIGVRSSWDASVTNCVLSPSSFSSSARLSSSSAILWSAGSKASEGRRGRTRRPRCRSPSGWGRALFDVGRPATASHAEEGPPPAGPEHHRENQPQRADDDQDDADGVLADACNVALQTPDENRPDGDQQQAYSESHSKPPFAVASSGRPAQPPPVYPLQPRG